MTKRICYVVWQTEGQAIDEYNSFVGVATDLKKAEQLVAWAKGLCEKNGLNESEIAFEIQKIQLNGIYVDWREGLVE